VKLIYKQRHRERRRHRPRAVLTGDIASPGVPPNQKINLISQVIFALAPPAASPMRRCPYRCNVPVVAAKAAPTRPFDTDVTRLHVPSAPASFAPRVNAALGVKNERVIYA